MNELSTTAIARAMGATRQTVLSRAEREHWLCKGEGRSLRWVSRGLPRDVLGVLLKEGLVSADISAGCASRALVAAKEATEGVFLAVSDKDRETAQLRSVLVGIFLHRTDRSNLYEFVERYNAGYVSRPILARLGSVSGATFYRWVRAYRDGGHTPAAVVPRYSLSKRERGPGASLSELAKHYLDYFWLRDSRPSMRSAILEVQTALPDERITYATAARYLSSIPAIIRDHKRYGVARMETMHLPHIERDYERYFAMDQLVSDHHCFDFIVEKDGNLFRPWITAVQDFRSAKIVGFFPSVYPSSMTISLAFYLAVSRFGSCKLIHIDNGKDYRSHVLNGTSKVMRVVNEEGFLEEELVNIQGAYSLFSEKVTFARPYHGASKGRMERTFGTFAQLFSRRMAGYVGSNTRERPDDAALYWRALNKRSRRHDIHSWDEYVRELASFVDWFNSSWHSEGAGMDGRTPDEVFAATAVPLRPVSPEVLAMAFSRSERRVVGRNGVRLDGVRYWDESLMRLVGTDVIVRRQIATPEEVIVSDPRGAFVCKATAWYFLETGDLAADNERLNAAKRKALTMVKEAQSVAATPPEGYRSIVEIASRTFPVAPERIALPLAAGGETESAPAPAPRAQREDREKTNAFLDRL